MNRLLSSLRVIMLTVVVSSFSLSEAATFRSATLKGLAQRLSLKADSLGEGMHLLHIDGRKAYILVENGVVENIGYQLFPIEMKMHGNSAMMDFLERYFMELQHPSAEKPAKLMMRDDRFKIEKGALGTVLQLRPEDGFGYSYSRKKYVATWVRNGEELLTVSFPMEYELIKGVTKIEAENDFEQRLRSVAVEHRPRLVPDIEVMTPSRIEGYYILEGGSYIDKRLNADTYYHRSAGSYSLVSDMSHPAETAANMMLSLDAEGDYQLNISQSLYGFKRKLFTVPLRQWVTMCQSQGCSLYFGLESFNEKEVSASVIAVNDNESYNHVMFVRIPLEVIDDKQGTIEARLDTYVPMHNVSDLFQTYRKDKNKEQKLFE